MKIRYLLVSAVLAATITGPGTDLQGQKQMTILDYYRLLPDGVMNKYEIKNNGVKWTVITDGDYTAPMDPVVDLKNGYIKIEIENKGSYNTVEAGLFLARGKNPVLCLTDYTRGIGTGGDIHVFEYKNGKMIKIGKGIIPKLSYGMFLDEKYDDSKIRDTGNFENLITVLFIIPRTGTTIKAYLDCSLLDYNVNDPERLKIHRDFMKNVKYRTIDLEWNSVDGKFTIGKKNKN